MPIYRDEQGVVIVESGSGHIKLLRTDDCTLSMAPWDGTDEDINSEDRIMLRMTFETVISVRTVIKELEHIERNLLNDGK